MKSARIAFDGKVPDGEMIAHRLGGNYNFVVQESKPGILRSATILSSNSMTKVQCKRLESLLTTKSIFGGEGMRCFNPGLGITIANAIESFDVLLCLRCNWAYFFRGETRMTEELSDSGVQGLTEIYDELFPGVRTE